MSCNCCFKRSGEDCGTVLSESVLDLRPSNAIDQTPFATIGSALDLIRLVWNGPCKRPYIQDLFKPYTQSYSGWLGGILRCCQSCYRPSFPEIENILEGLYLEYGPVVLGMALENFKTSQTGNSNLSLETLRHRLTQSCHWAQERLGSLFCCLRGAVVDHRGSSSSSISYESFARGLITTSGVQVCHSSLVEILPKHVACCQCFFDPSQRKDSEKLLVKIYCLLCQINWSPLHS